MNKDFLEVAQRVAEYGQNAVWRTRSTDPIDEGAHSTDDVARSWQVPERTAKLLYLLANTMGAKRILELGTSIGYSTLWLAKAAEENGGKVDTIEHFDLKAVQAMKHIEAAGLTAIVNVHVDEIENVLGTWNSPLDLVFMDADKGKYTLYLDLILPHLRKGGLIVVDNAENFEHRLKNFFTKVKEDEGLLSELIPIDNGLLLITKLYE